MTSQFPYKTVLMVGATAGIGRALAERMIENGIFVIAVGRRKERLDEFVAKHGSDKTAASQFDITDFEGHKAWAEGIIKAYPALDSVFLNSGIQHSLDFTDPKAIDLSRVRKELDTNYLSYISLISHLLPHLQSLSPKPASLVMVSSGLAIVPLPRCGNYCATKSALHSLAWSIRSQLSDDEKSKHVRVIEVMPPAVKTELHELQEDLRKAGPTDFGMPLDEFTDETWEGLTGGLEEIPVGDVRTRFIKTEEGKREAFKGLVAAFKGRNAP